MNGSGNDYELANLLKQIADSINNDEFGKLGGLLARVRRLRRKGVRVDSNVAAPVLEAFTKAISEYIEEDEYDDALETIDDLGEFLETCELPIGEETAHRISDAYIRKISRLIDGGEYEDAEEWIEDFREFLEDFELTADENLISKVVDSYTSLVEAYIAAKKFHKADEIKELLSEFKEEAKPFKWSTGPKPKVLRPAVKTASLRCANCGKELPPETSFCPVCGKPVN